MPGLVDVRVVGVVAGVRISIVIRRPNISRAEPDVAAAAVGVIARIVAVGCRVRDRRFAVRKVAGAAAVTAA